MARECQICGKKLTTGNRVSHSHRKTRRLWQPNLIKKRVFYRGQWQILLLCAKCLKRLTA